MPAKNEPGGSNRYAFLVRRAFDEAELGDRDSAMAYWNLAMKEGYEPKEKTKKQLMYKLRLSAENVGTIDDHKPEGEGS